MARPDLTPAPSRKSAARGRRRLTALPPAPLLTWLALQHGMQQLSPPLLSEIVPRREDATRLDLLAQELASAREFCRDLPEDPILALDWLEEAVCSLVHVPEARFLVFDPVRGVYACLNDLRQPEQPMREITQLSDAFLDHALGDGPWRTSFLAQEHSFLGLVCVRGPNTWSDDDQARLDLAARYLAPPLQRFQQRVRQQREDRLSSGHQALTQQLIGCASLEQVFLAMCETFGRQHGFFAAQWMQADADGQTTSRQTWLAPESWEPPTSFEPAGALCPLRREWLAIFSAEGGSATPVRTLRQPWSGVALDDLFGLPGIETSLILPVWDEQAGEPLGVYVFHHASADALPPDVLEAAHRALGPLSLALSRAGQLAQVLAGAARDELTGLTNRRGFLEGFEREVDRARRNLSSLTVAMVDVDHFKQLNDQYGHLNGDAVLKTLAGLLLSNVRKTDLVCRFGGEEFVLLLPDTRMADAAEMVERIRRQVAQMPFPGVHGEALSVSFSAGLAEVPLQLARPVEGLMADALEQADTQLYRAKAQGRNRVCIACPDVA